MPSPLPCHAEASCSRISTVSYLCVQVLLRSCGIICVLQVVRIRGLFEAKAGLVSNTQIQPSSARKLLVLNTIPLYILVSHQLVTHHMPLRWCLLAMSRQHFPSAFRPSTVIIASEESKLLQRDKAAVERALRAGEAELKQKQHPDPYIRETCQVILFGLHPRYI